MRLNTPESLGHIIEQMQARLGRLENAQRSAVATVPTDPANPRDGDTWLRTSDNTFRIRINGVTKTITVT